MRLIINTAYKYKTPLRSIRVIISKSYGNIVSPVDNNARSSSVD